MPMVYTKRHVSTVFSNDADRLTCNIQTWEPTFRHIVELSNRKTTGICIDEIWSIDFANAGDSALVNAGKLGDVCTFITFLARHPY